MVGKFQVYNWVWQKIMHRRFFSTCLKCSNEKSFFRFNLFFQKIRVLPRVNISGSIKDFWSSKVETFLLQYFFSEFLMESRSYRVEHFNYSTNFQWYPKHTRLTFGCKFSWESTPLLLSRVANFFPVTKSVAVRRAVAFNVQAKKAWDWRKIYNNPDSQFCKNC